MKVYLGLTEQLDDKCGSSGSSAVLHGHVQGTDTQLAY
jgi:hypothetical protein